MAGKRYWFEPVPTDVEQGPDGMLYVTSLPGGPEDGSLGANAAVYRVNPAHRQGRQGRRDGLVSATGLAVAGNGDIFVAELFRGRISRIKAGKSTARTFLKVPLPADVELTSQGMFATINALPGEAAARRPARSCASAADPRHDKDPGDQTVARVLGRPGLREPGRLSASIWLASLR